MLTPIFRNVHWNGNVVILTKCASLAESKVVILTTSGTANDANLVKMTTFTGATLIDYISGYYVQDGGKLNAVKIPVVFLFWGAYLQQIWVMHYVARIILDTRETSFSFIVYRVTCYRFMTRRRKT